MSLDKATVAHVAKLARIRVDDGDLEPLANELSNILTWIEQLGEAARSSYALGLRLTVAVAVGVAIVIGVFRIVVGWPIHRMIAGGYLLVVLLTAVAPPDIVGIAYDSGGVTTSTVTVPLVTALGVGLASSLEGRNPVSDGFGLIAFASLTPMIFVMLYGIWLA